jgi:hypothetical protein
VTKRLSPALSALVDVALLWACLLATFHWLPAERPTGWLLLTAAVIRLLIGVATTRAWLNHAIVVLLGGLCYYFLWARGPDIAGLAAWFLLDQAFRLRHVPLRAGQWVLGLRILRWPGRVALAFFRAVQAAVVAPSARYWRSPLLLLAGLALMIPYLTRGLVGAGDAHWYANVVADFIRQIRAGQYPVWVGQTDLAFLGGTFPLRVAPYLQHLTALIDLLTGRRLFPFTLLHLALAGSFVGGLFSCYFCLGYILPRRPWTAAALALLYATCPGVLGLGYAQDLYMSFTTLPFLPVVFLGIVRSFDRDDALSRELIAGGLAAAWLAHPPIALWCGIVTAATQGVRIFRHGWTWRTLQLDLMALGIFAALAGYTFVSVASLGPRIVDGSGWQSELFEVQRAFPGNWLPLPRIDTLENLQLGYGLAAVLIVLVAGRFRRRDPLAMALSACAGILFALIVPIPLVTSGLWHLVPPAVMRLTKTWPMQRLLVILALCTVFGFALRLRHAAPPRLLAALLAVAVCWSGWQGYREAAFGFARSYTRAAAERVHRTENVVMSESDLGISPYRPRFFGNGVMNPTLESYFLDREGAHELRGSATDGVAPGFGPGPKPTAPDLSGRFTGTLDVNPGVLNLLPLLTLEPGRHYVLLFQFLQPSTTGVLIIRGENLDREYVLPSGGGPWAFGSGPENSRIIPLWTSLDRPETVRLQFVATGAAARPLQYAAFARFELRPYELAQLPIQVESLLPYQASVRSDRPAYLETPRLLIEGYQATVDGAPVPVDRSVDGLAIVPIPAGLHQVSLSYVAPLRVRVAYWFGLGAWVLYFWLMFKQLRGSSGQSALRQPVDKPGLV